MKQVLQLPNVLFIGPEKTGTTWIHEYLRSRGDIVLPDGVKETWFFSKYFDHGVEWYSSHFKPKGTYRSIVEVDPTLFSHPEAPKRVHEALGHEVLIICTLRDPVKRSFSHYLHARRYGWTNKPFRQAVLEIPEIIDASRYAKHIQRWMRIFGRDRVLVFLQEDLARNPDEFVARLCYSMDVPYIPVPSRLRARVNKALAPRSVLLARFVSRISLLLRAVRLYGLLQLAKRLGLKKYFYRKPNRESDPQLSEEDRCWLLKGLLGEIEVLEKILGVDLSFWKGKC